MTTQQPAVPGAERDRGDRVLDPPLGADDGAHAARDERRADRREDGRRGTRPPARSVGRQASAAMTAIVRPAATTTDLMVPVITMSTRASALPGVAAMELAPHCRPEPGECSGFSPPGSTRQLSAQPAGAAARRCWATLLGDIVRKCPAKTCPCGQEPAPSKWDENARDMGDLRANRPASRESTEAWPVSCPGTGPHVLPGFSRAGATNSECSRGCGHWPCQLVRPASILRSRGSEY